jgi:hypothetical protein
MPGSRSHDIPLPTLSGPQRVMLLLLATIGVASPFLPFTWSTSPLDVIVRAPRLLLALVQRSSGEFLFVLLALPFFLPPLACLISIRMLVGNRFAEADLLAARISSIAGAFATLGGTIWWSVAKGLRDPQHWAAIACCWAVIAGGLVFVTRWRSRNLMPAGVALTSLHVVYIANALFCLGIFWPNWESGAIVTAFTVVALAMHMAILAATAIPSGNRHLRGEER